MVGRVLSVTLLVIPLAILSEFIFQNKKKKKVTEAVFVTSMLYSLSLPPGVPLWIAAIGIVLGVVVGKELFGGFGRNIFNPAILGRLFVYLSFPILMQTTWIAPGAYGSGYNNAAFYMSNGIDSLYMILVAWGTFTTCNNKKR